MADLDYSGFFNEDFWVEGFFNYRFWPIYVSVQLPTDRTATVAAESRTATVAAESRTTEVR